MRGRRRTEGLRSGPSSVHASRGQDAQERVRASEWSAEAQTGELSGGLREGLLQWAAGRDATSLLTPEPIQMRH